VRNLVVLLTTRPAAQGHRGSGKSRARQASLRSFVAATTAGRWRTLYGNPAIASSRSGPSRCARAPSCGRDRARDGDSSTRPSARCSPKSAQPSRARRTASSPSPWVMMSCEPALSQRSAAAPIESGLSGGIPAVQAAPRERTVVQDRLRQRTSARRRDLRHRRTVQPRGILARRG